MENQGNSTEVWDNDILIDNDEIGPQVTKSHYYDMDQFNDLSKNFINESNISVLSINARSLLKNINEFSVILEEFLISFDVINVVETWLNDLLEPLVKLHGYTFISKHKSQRREGGGVGIYIRDGIEYIERVDLDSPDGNDDLFTSKFIEIKQETPIKNAIVGVLYRPPGKNSITELNNYLDALLSKLNKENKSITISGDTNINLLKYSEHKPTTDYLDTLLSHGMIPKITVPTRVTHSSATLIDHIFVNETPDRACPAGTIKSSMTDHYFNFVFLGHNKQWKYPKTVTYRPFSESNIKKFDEAIRNHDFTDLFQMSDPNEAYDNLISNYNTILNRVIPMKTVRFNKHKHSLKPWITSNIRQSIKYRDKLHQKVKKN